METWQYVFWIPVGILVLVLLGSVAHQIGKDRHDDVE